MVCDSPMYVQTGEATLVWDLGAGTPLKTQGEMSFIISSHRKTWNLSEKQF